MRLRIHPITDIVLKPKDLSKLRKGFHVFKSPNGHKHCIYVKLFNNNPTMRKIIKLENRIKILKRTMELQKGIK